jgi:hypothetical protein
MGPIRKYCYRRSSEMLLLDVKPGRHRRFRMVDVLSAIFFWIFLVNPTGEGFFVVSFRYQRGVFCPFRSVYRLNRGQF